MSTLTAQWGSYLELTKPRLSFLAILMGVMGFWLADPWITQKSVFYCLLIGQALLGASAGMLNQYLEIDVDSKMARTSKRPLPMGRLHPSAVLRTGMIVGLLGLAVLLFGTNSVATTMGALTLFLYLSVYTPAKKTDPLSTLIGAIPGALPPLIGYTAAHGRMGAPGWWLFGVVFIWQIPHFLAIAWLYKEQYAKADLPVLPVVDSEDYHTTKQAILYSLVLLPFSLLPLLWRMANTNYYAHGAILLGASMILFSFLLSIQKTPKAARRLFWCSLVYLPLLTLLLILNKP